MPQIYIPLTKSLRWTQNVFILPGKGDKFRKWHILYHILFCRYMDDEESGAIKLKSCPRCLTPIRTSLRYSNVIKQQLCDIEKVKIRAYGHPNEMRLTKQKLQARLTGLKTIFADKMEEWKRLESSLKGMTRVTVAVTENRVMFMEKFCVIRQKLDQCFLCHAPRNLSTDIVMTGKYEIMKVSYQPLYTPVESYC